MFRRYFIAGVLVWVPIWVTLLVIRFLVEIMDQSLALIPEAYQPQNLIGFKIPGLGLVFTLLVMFFTGVIMTHFLGHKLLALWERLLGRIPLVRSIYSSVKQVLQAILSSKGKAFRKVVLVEYPRREMWSIAFQTSEGFHVGEEKHIDRVGKDLITIFVPTTPNPTSGYLMVVPRSDVIQLDMNVDEALKMVISLGVVLPGSTPNKNNNLSKTGANDA